MNTVFEGARGCLTDQRTDTGRRRFEEVSLRRDDIIDVDDPFVKDECKILPSKSFRLLCEKTQVATAPVNKLIRNRMTHTLEVVAHSVRIARILGLNERLARSIALGHDMGHGPFGHQGERFLADAMGRKEFCHEVMGVVIAQKIERKGRGLNLTRETLEGMMCHSGAKAHRGMTQEAWVVRYADKIAYLFSDYNDMVRMGYPVSKELQMLMRVFGESQRERVMKTITALILETYQKGSVSFDECDFAQKFKRLRTLMYLIYPKITQQRPDRHMEPVLEYLTRLDMGDPFLLLWLMTDNDVLYLSSQSMLDMSHLKQTAVCEMLPHLEAIGKVDMCNPDLDW